MNTAFPTVEHEADLCVVGGGLAGLCAAVSAARHGARVLLMQDRPMLGGNASSEIRMWVCGAHGDNNRETGLLEEISMDNMARNPDKNYSIWDGILYEKARYQPEIELLLNCTCLDAEMAGSSIAAVTGWRFGNVKVGFDAALVSTALVLSLLFFHRLQGLGAGTILSALAVGRFVNLYNRRLPLISRISALAS